MAAGGHLFYAKKERILNDEQHLAEMVSLMGPPPPEFLQRSAKSSQYWDSKGSVSIPEQSLDTRVNQYRGEHKELFLSLLRRVLRWLPETRPSAEELAYDTFLMQSLLRVRAAA
ncbi:hypothetical protein N7452_001558 [Penicillium brevicompactum]|uniref:Uncharacterized protein n=1 Tax=Penicillium brevicompactum TaxID=5074 RepID=A0A9W9UQ76_PENBR|nr:hypothetical protein N7452_001558 [Penicillium brevicompactum]